MIPPEPQFDLEWWTQRFSAKMGEAKQSPEIDVLLIGDSITHTWEDHQPIWDQFFPGVTTLNIGFSGDRTEHLTWRLQNGSVDLVRPTVSMLLIGTNNTGHRMDPPHEVARSIEVIVDELQKRLPDSRIVLLGVFPRGQHSDSPDRRNNLTINEHICHLGDRPDVSFLDVSNEFFADDGSLTRGVSEDFLHLNAEGYRIWAQAIQPLVQQLLAGDSS